MEAGRRGQRELSNGDERCQGPAVEGRGGWGGTRSDLECSSLKAALTGFPDGLMIIITVEIDDDRIW